MWLSPHQAASQQKHVKNSFRWKGRTATTSSNQDCSSQRQTRLGELTDAQNVTVRAYTRGTKDKGPNQRTVVRQGAAQQSQLLEQEAGKQGFPNPLPLVEEGPLADRYMDSGGKTDVWLTRASPKSFIKLPNPEAYAEPASKSAFSQNQLDSHWLPAPTPKSQQNKTKVSKGTVYHNQV